MNLNEAKALIMPYLKHSGLDALLNENEEFKQLHGKIREKMKGMSFHPEGEPLPELDKEAEGLFQRYAEICGDVFGF
ncbi:MAG: hypothetical protein KAS02_01180 [Candidatus Pacebacteria bacterium]|nr:hypothetical protein [Candidatus Paceibacterota bacterium]